VCGCVCVCVCMCAPPSRAACTSRAQLYAALEAALVTRHNCGVAPPPKHDVQRHKWLMAPRDGANGVTPATALRAGLSDEDVAFPTDTSEAGLVAFADRVKVHHHEWDAAAFICECPRPADFGITGEDAGHIDAGQRTAEAEHFYAVACVVWLWLCVVVWLVGGWTASRHAPSHHVRIVAAGRQSWCAFDCWRTQACGRAAFPCALCPRKLGSG